MKGVRVTLAVLALSAMPFVALAAQGRSADNKCKNTPQAGQNGNSQRGAAAVATAQANKCPAPVPPPPAAVPPPAVVPPPPPSEPPTGPNQVSGVVFEDLDGNGAQDVYSGEMGLAGWTVQLVWNGQVWATRTSDADGNFSFTGLGMTTYSVCLVAQGGYVQTLPVGAMATGCNGAGYTDTFTNTIGTLWLTNFGEMLP